MSATTLTNEVSHQPLEKQAEFLETLAWLETLKPWHLCALQHFVALYQLGLIPADNIPAAKATFVQICEKYRPADPRAARVQ